MHARRRQRVSEQAQVCAARARATTSVAVCVATYRRPIYLQRLLRSLSELSFLRQPQPDLSIVVVDNCEEKSARAVVESARGDMPWQLRYAVEPRRNIALARNRAVELALQDGAEWIAFIDDDEVAAPQWLDELLNAQQRYGAAVVGGPVIPRYHSSAEPWVIRGGYFDPPRWRTGSVVKMVHTNNSLVARDLVSRGPPFDPAFGTSGGSDTHFFLRARRSGISFVWADEAVVEETISASRTNARWILQRAFRVGNAYVFCERSIDSPGRVVPGHIIRALARISLGSLLLSGVLFGGRATVVRALCKISHGLGALAGVMGVRYREYVRIHGE